MSKIIFFDLEADGLLDATKIHIVGWWELGQPKEIKATTDYDEMRELFSQDAIFVGHNCFMYDFIVIKNILGVEVNLGSIDTLPLSHYLRPLRVSHSLESYQTEVGVAKVQVDNWKDGSIELYRERVTEDVKIQVNLFYLFVKELKAIYETDDFEKIKSIMLFISSYYRDYHISYFTPFIVDKPLLAEYIEELTEMRRERVDKVKAIMPPVMMEVTKPKTHKKDGTLSEAGKKWFKLLEEHNLPFDSETVLVKKEEPNPASSEQVKDWLLSLGWQPTYFKDGANGPVPQVRTKDGNLCPNISRLNLEETKVFEDLSVVSNRLSNLKRIKENTIDGKVAADIGGLTNTLRIKHRTLVNLTKVSALHGKYERGILGCAEDEVLIGSDLSSLENYTRTNLVCDIDPSSVDELLDPDFDTHLAIATTAGLLVEDDVIFYKQFKKDGVGDKSRFDNIDKIRSKAKTVSYSALYGVGAPKLAKELKVPVREAQILLDAYWRKNFAVKVFERKVEIKQIGNQMWVKHPVSNLYYSLRSRKDIFSTINQSFGAFIFKLWVNKMWQRKIKITAQFHDEVVIRCPKGMEDTYTKLIRDSLEEVNKLLNLKIPIRCDVKVGVKYSEIH